VGRSPPAPASGARKLVLAVLAVLASAACRAFPVGMYVPDAVLDTLARTPYVEELDERALARELARRAGWPIAPADLPRARYWRLDEEPARGPLAPAAFDARAGAATVGLASGDLVLVKNGRAQSLGTTLSLAEFTFYDHLGVLVERDGLWQVCDSWPSFHPLGKSQDFAARFRGGVRATPLSRFLAHYETLLFVRVADPAGAARLAAAALDSLDQGIEYDPRHDERDSRLSCSEYLLALFERAGLARPPHPRAVSASAELRALLAALGFPTRGFVVPDQFAALPGARAVAWVSRHDTPQGARSVEAVFARLHARFARGEPLGAFLAVDRYRFLRYRANVAQLLRWAEGWARARGCAERARLEQELEELMPLFFHSPQ
jgi:hypothetical protein